jgi:hypothetical protein
MINPPPGLEPVIFGLASNVPKLVSYLNKLRTLGAWLLIEVQLEEFWHGGGKNKAINGNSKHINKNATRTEYLYTHTHNMGEHTINFVTTSHSQN